MADDIEEGPDPNEVRRQAKGPTSGSAATSTGGSSSCMHSRRRGTAEVRAGRAAAARGWRHDRVAHAANAPARAAAAPSCARTPPRRAPPWRGSCGACRCSRTGPRSHRRGPSARPRRRTAGTAAPPSEQEWAITPCSSSGDDLWLPGRLRQMGDVSWAMPTASRCAGCPLQIRWITSAAYRCWSKPAGSAKGCAPFEARPPQQQTTTTNNNNSRQTARWIHIAT